MKKQSRLASLRRYHNYTQEEVSSWIGISSRAYSDRENGYSEFKLNEMFIISKRFNLPIEEIFLQTDFMPHEVEEVN